MMIHPSYMELINKLNEKVAPGEKPLVESRYSVVIATSRRARQVVDQRNASGEVIQAAKPLSEAVDEIFKGTCYILGKEEFEKEQAAIMERYETEEAIKAVKRAELKTIREAEWEEARKKAEEEAALHAGEEDDETEWTDEETDEDDDEDDDEYDDDEDEDVDGEELSEKEAQKDDE